MCNQKSTFNITTGDAPGVCAGVASASIGQMAQFKEGSKTVNFCGEPAVCNGKLMTGNMDNTGPQPLQQPPCQNPPAGTAEAPVAMTGEFSQQVNLANIIGYVTGTETLWARPPYEVCDKDGKRIAQGMLDKKGNIERFYTAEKEKVTIWLGDGGWRIFGGTRPRQGGSNRS